jgi:hypothetical protein
LVAAVAAGGSQQAGSKYDMDKEEDGE